MQSGRSSADLASALYHVAETNAHLAGSEMEWSRSDFDTITGAAGRSIDTMLLAVCEERVSVTIAALYGNCEITSDREVTSRFGQPGVLAKRIMRRAVRWYVAPIVREQNALNRKLYEALLALNARELARKLQSERMSVTEKALGGADEDLC